MAEIGCRVWVTNSPLGKPASNPAPLLTSAVILNWSSEMEK